MKVIFRSMKCLRIVIAIIQIFIQQTIVFLKKKIYFCEQQNENMIQRIQSIYILFAIVLTAVLPFIFPLWYENGNKIYFMGNMTYTALFGLSTSLGVISFLSFKKRQSQFVFNRLNIILNLILLGLFVYRTLNLSGGAQAPEKGIGMFLPIITILLLVLANKAIKKDEDLVKSVDRLR